MLIGPGRETEKMMLIMAPFSTFARNEMLKSKQFLNYSDLDFTRPALMKN